MWVWEGLKVKMHQVEVVEDSEPTPHKPVRGEVKQQSIETWTTDLWLYQVQRSISSGGEGKCRMGNGRKFWKEQDFMRNSNDTGTLKTNAGMKGQCARF